MRSDIDPRPAVPAALFPALLLAGAASCVGTVHLPGSPEADGAVGRDAPVHQQDASSPDVPDDIDAAQPPVDGAPPDRPPTDSEPVLQCGGSYAYLHGDLWPMWYNMRVACDPEHRALWRCERIHGQGAQECDGLRAHYEECQSWASPWPCLNWGVCAPVDEGNDCGTDVPSKCDTRTFDYDAPNIWGTYYGLRWSRPELHRFLTIKVHDASGNLIVAFSSNPQSADAYMDGQDNFGVGPAPQGFIQLAQTKDDRFGTFACIRLPAGQPLTLWAAWMNEFCHTCKSDYPSYPNTPCSVELTMTFEPGRHYLWTERGIEEMPTCDGPPPEIQARFPQASCSTVGR